MKNLQKTGFKFFTIFCVLVIASSCGGGGGGGGMSGSSGANGAEIVPASDVSSSNNTSYGFSKTSIVVSANSGTSELKTPAFLKNAKVQASQPNKKAKGAGIYSEALQKIGIAQINLSLTIDGVTTEYKLNPNDALVLKQITAGTKIVASGTVQTNDQITRNIVQKEYDIESFQDILPLFVEYKATLKNSSNTDIQTFTYSTDKPIELPVLNDITVTNDAGDALGVAPFLGWQVSASGLSIDKNFYAKGTTVPAGELCGDIEFYADYGFCVYCTGTYTNTIIGDAGIEAPKGVPDGYVAIQFMHVNHDGMFVGDFESINVTNTAIARLGKQLFSYVIVPKDIGNTTLVATGNSLRGNTYTVQIPVTVEIYSAVFIEGREVEIYATWCCDHEVTQKEYVDIMGSVPRPYTNDEVGDDYPVNYVSWYEALVYCNKRSMVEKLTPCYTINSSTNPDDWGTVPSTDDATWNSVTCDFNANGYRLPTEAEWEYFARGDRKENHLYSGSNNIDDVAWYAYNSDDKRHEVKRKKPNAFGLYDMSGNVEEWCWDWYYNTITTSTPSTGPASATYRVIRGGCYYSGDNNASVGYREFSYPDSRYSGSGNGFRVVRTAE